MATLSGDDSEKTSPPKPSPRPSADSKSVGSSFPSTDAVQTPQLADSSSIEAKHHNVVPILDPSELEYPEGGLQAWLVVFGSWSAMAAGFGTVNTIGVFEAYISSHQLASYDKSSIGWIFGVLVFLVFFCGVQIGPVFDAKGPRMLLALGGVLLVIAMFTLGLCTSYWSLMLNLGLTTGIAASLLFTPAIAAVAHWFNVHRGTATGIAATGGSAGGIMFPLMLQALLPRVGFAWATRILGFVLLTLCILGVLLCRSRIPPKKGTATRWTDMLFDPRIFWDGTGALFITTMGIFFVEWGYFIPVTYLTTYYLAREGLGDAVDGPGAFAYQIVAIVNAASCFGRWLPGAVADRWGRYNTMILSIILCLIAVLGLWLSDALAPQKQSVALLVVFAITFGFASGSNISLTPICVGQLCDTRDYGRYYASAYTIVSFGSLTGIPIAGALIQATGGEGREMYWGVILFTGLSYVASLACFTWVRISIKGFNLSIW